ncbi:hypothetical protein NSB04_04835 [Blautia pseudococcoides]|uniref:Uncharacterized protein n=1 Tax=Blautia pseudococcoides TaxID=1796616 RepID=A0A1C7IBP8_9FIRM|nr:hypothetical protein [uncultured Blautia sp.]ANU75652.1 hypothetical protein A4V09_07660 [Blautia pseudococcoides]ASU28455.1 hypothetical protein ADH70_006030 [Blautia pseudococcoides]MCR2019072.1 hypothetical protein [Blautia pseudococcoides]
MEGIRCGQQCKEAESNLLQSGYRNLGDSDPRPAVHTDLCCSEYGTIKLSGFDDAITLGDTFWNSQAMHTS